MPAEKVLALPFPAPAETLRRFGLRAKKSFGQNFVREPGVVERAADLLGATPLRVLEIGAGLGALTFALLARGHWVTAIERDRDLVPVLAQLGADALASGRLRILEEDAKSADFLAMLDAQPSDTGVPAARAIVGNVPYNLTGPLLRKAMEAAQSLQSAMFLVQREVADRLAARPGDDAYGALSVFTQAAFEVRPAFTVSRGVFYPAPRVDSRVVVLSPHVPPRAEETRLFRALVRGAFTQRRKKLRNAWRSLLAPTAGRGEAAVACAGISLDQRGETLSVEDFKRVADALAEVEVDS